MKIDLQIPGKRIRSEPPRLDAHTNGADTGMPHELLIRYIDGLEARLNEVYRLSDDSIILLGQLSCEGHPEAFCPRCEARKKLGKIRTLTDLTRKDIEIV